jgi:hypothetical protein
MANIAASWVQVNPSMMIPEIMMQYNQSSGAFATIPNEEPQVRLSEGDKAVYIKTLRVTTKTVANQSVYNQIPSVSTNFAMISIPTYWIRVRAEWDHHDGAAVSKWGVSIEESQRLGTRQGTFQQMRDMLLYGFNPSNGEGITNTPLATKINLPPDSNGDTTVITYDNGQMSAFLLSQIAALKTRTLQTGLENHYVFVGPQRIINTWMYSVVQLVQFQRVGAGTTSTAGVVHGVGEWNLDNFSFLVDDTLIGKGNGGTDLVILTMPELKRPMQHRIETNEFAKLTNGNMACNLMFCDMPAPREIPTPIPGGAIDVVSELMVTPGWGVRPEATTLMSMQYQ